MDIIFKEAFDEISKIANQWGVKPDKTLAWRILKEIKEKINETIFIYRE